MEALAKKGSSRLAGDIELSQHRQRMDQRAGERLGLTETGAHFQLMAEHDAAQHAELGNQGPGNGANAAQAGGLTAYRVDAVESVKAGAGSPTGHFHRAQEQEA